MKTKKEIENRIEDTKKALEDLNDRGNLTPETHAELRSKIDAFEWVIE